VAAKASVSIGSLYQYFPNKDAIVLALINSFEQTLRNAVMEVVQAGRGQALKRRLKLVVRALVMVHYRPRLNRMLEAEEERLGGAAEDSAFHGIVLQLLREHKNEVVMPITRTMGRVVMAILRAVVDLGLTSSASPGSTEQRAMRAVCGYLLYAG
jgi:AcrR family transcriptional regulator